MSSRKLSAGKRLSNSTPGTGRRTSGTSTVAYNVLGGRSSLTGTQAQSGNESANTPLLQNSSPPSVCSKTQPRPFSFYTLPYSYSDN